MDTVGDRIKTLRKANDMTQKEFSEYIGVSRSTLAGYETGKIEPSLNVIFNLSNKFDINPTYFLRTMYVDIPSEDDANNDIISKLDELMDLISTQDISVRNSIVKHESDLSRLIYFQIKQCKESILKLNELLNM